MPLVSRCLLVSFSHDQCFMCMRRIVHGPVILSYDKITRLICQCTLGTQDVPKTGNKITQYSTPCLTTINLHFYSAGISVYFGFRYVSRTQRTDKGVPDLTKLTRSVPKSGGTTHGYCLGTFCVPRVCPSQKGLCTWPSPRWRRGTIPQSLSRQKKTHIFLLRHHDVPLCSTSHHAYISSVCFFVRLVELSYISVHDILPSITAANSLQTEKQHHLRPCYGS